MEYMIIQSRISTAFIVEEADSEDRFNTLIEQYRAMWTVADAEKKASGKISRKTSRQLAKIADELNREENRK